MSHCLFCPTEKLTNEHIWPDWLVKEFSKRLPKQKGLYTSTVTHHGKFIRSYPANDITEKRKLVCEPCNSIWMSQLENETKQILLPLILHADTPKYFSVLDQCTIAAWMTLRSMVFDGINPSCRDGHYYYSLSERTAFALSDYLAPPPNTTIWLAPYIGKRWSVHLDGLSYVNTTDDRFYIVSCLMNEIAIQLVTWRGRHRLHSGKLNQDGWNTATLRLWPPRKRPLPWPTPRHLNGAGLQSFYDRFKPPGTT
jgi:hypothetical protein